MSNNQEVPDDLAAKLSAKPAKACFKCGVTGHKTKNCKAKTGDLKVIRKCYRCGKNGHIGKDCPNPSEGDAGAEVKKACFKCGDTSHLSKECPQKAGGAPADGEDDEAPDAKKRRLEAPVAKKKGCFKCGEQGHNSRRCPNGFRCPKCGETGHDSKDCPNFQPPTQSSASILNRGKNF